MGLKQKCSYKKVAVLGAGKFGTAVANLLSYNVDHVLLYTHRPERAIALQNGRMVDGQTLAQNIEVTNDLPMVLQSCLVIFPIVPAANFRALMKSMALYLTADHVLIHGTKGLDFSKEKGDMSLTNQDISTMSQVITQETSVDKIGCLAGPNLSIDLWKKHPAATVVASDSKEVLEIGCRLLSNDWFCVFQSNQLLSVEFCSVLKNIFAIGAGLLRGCGYGENTYAFFLTVACLEMQDILMKLGVSTQAFLGPAGLGDLIATCNSHTSRNYTMGYRIANGETLEELLSARQEVSEGVKTVQIMYRLMQSYGCNMVLTKTIYRILFEKVPVHNAIDCLMNYAHNKSFLFNF